MYVPARVVKTVFVLATMMLVGGGRRLSGQFFTSHVQAYQDRASQIRRDIAAISNASRDCDPAAREAIHKRLLALQAQFNLLRSNWSAFKKDNSGRDPNSWGSYDEQIIGHTQADLDQQLKIWEESALLCTSPARATPVDTPQAPPPKTERPRRDPLAGLVRPQLPDVKIPAETTFCTDDEKTRWIQQVISPLLNQLTQATNPARDYIDLVDDRLNAATKAQSADTSTLKTEREQAKAEHDWLDSTYDKVRAVVDSSKVIDCTPHVTVPLPPEVRPDTSKPPRPVPGESMKPGAQPSGGGTRALPRYGLPVWRPFVRVALDWSDFPNFKRVAGNQPYIESVDASNSAGGYGVELGAQYRANELSFGRHFCSLRVRQHYIPTMSRYSELDGRVDGSVYNFSFGHWITVTQKVNLGLAGSYLVTYDKLVYENAVESDGAKVTLAPKTLTLGKGSFGAWLSYRYTRHVDLELGATDATSFNPADADNQFRGSVGMKYSF